MSNGNKPQGQLAAQAITAPCRRAPDLRALMCATSGSVEDVRAQSNGDDVNPAHVDPDAWVDALTDDEFGEILGPRWYELTGRNVDHLIPGHSEDAA